MVLLLSLAVGNLSGTSLSFGRVSKADCAIVRCDGQSGSVLWVVSQFDDPDSVSAICVSSDPVITRIQRVRVTRIKEQFSPYYVYGASSGWNSAATPWANFDWFARAWFANRITVNFSSM